MFRSISGMSVVSSFAYSILKKPKQIEENSDNHMSNWKSAVTPLTSRTRSHVSRSSECLRKHFGFLILNAIFSQVKCQVKKIFSGFLIDIEIYRISIFQRKKDYVSFKAVLHKAIYHFPITRHFREQ